MLSIHAYQVVVECLSCGIKEDNPNRGIPDICVNLLVPNIVQTEHHLLSFQVALLCVDMLMSSESSLDQICLMQYLSRQERNSLVFSDYMHCPCKSAVDQFLVWFHLLNQTPAKEMVIKLIDT